MARYQLEKIEIRFNLSLYLLKNIEKLPWEVLFVASYNFANGEVSKNMKLFTNPLTTLRAGF